VSDLASELERVIRAIVRDEMGKARAEAAAHPFPDHITAKEYARRFSISVSTVLDAVHDGRLSAVRIGRVIRIPSDASMAKPVRGSRRGPLADGLSIEESARRAFQRYQHLDELRAGRRAANMADPDDRRIVERAKVLETALRTMMKLDEMASTLGISQALARQMVKDGIIPYERVLEYKLFRRDVVLKLKKRGWRP
jgi:excisionase family DNA binding protein